MKRSPSFLTGSSRTIVRNTTGDNIGIIFAGDTLYSSCESGAIIELCQSRTQSPQAPWSAVWSPGETLGKWDFFNFFDWLFA